MGKNLKRVVLTLSLVAAVSMASNSFAQNASIAVKFNAVGSSAAFNAFALAAGNATGGKLCGTNNWTLKSGGSGHDSRSSSISDVSGNIWIVWNGLASGGGTTQVCSYLSIDSVVGSRLFFAQPRGVLTLPSSDVGAAGANLVPLLPADVPLPQSVFNALNNAAFNAAPSDIRPEDALFATTRALGTFANKCNPAGGGLGYGPGPIGQTILSEFSTKSAQVVNFAIMGTDPISGQKIPAFLTTDVGAQVVLVLANTSDTSSSGLGNASFNNIDRSVAGKVWDGTLSRTRDLIPSTGLASTALHVLNREPLSGTFNTFEFCIPGNIEINSTQECGVNPATDNPLNLTDADGASRQRVIGTGEMTSEVGSIEDALGYAFFSFGNVSGITTTAKYLAVDGVDPLFANYTTGALPTCTAPCPGEVTFPNVVNGSYPVWNVLVVDTANPAPTFVESLITTAQTQIANIPDFVPNSSLEVFRSHYTQSGVAPQNGHVAHSKESGGSMGGGVFTVQADLDSITDTGKQLVGFKQ